MAYKDEEEKRRRAQERKAAGEQYQQKREELLKKNAELNAAKPAQTAKNLTGGTSRTSATAAGVNASAAGYAKKNDGDNDMAKVVASYNKEQPDIAKMTYEQAMGFATRIVYDDERDDFLSRWQKAEKKKSGSAPTMDEMRAKLNSQKPGGLYRESKDAYAKETQERFGQEYDAAQTRAAKERREQAEKEREENSGVKGAIKKGKEIAAGAKAAVSEWLAGAGKGGAVWNAQGEAYTIEDRKAAPVGEEKPERTVSTIEWQGAKQKTPPSLEDAMQDDTFMQAFIEKKIAEDAGALQDGWQGPRQKSLMQRALEDGEYQAFVEEQLAKGEEPKETQGPTPAPMLGAQEDNKRPQLIDTIVEKYGAPDAKAGMGITGESGSVDLTGDLGKAWFEYKEAGRFDELSPETQQMLSDLYAQDGVKAWMGVLGDREFSKFALKDKDGNTAFELNNVPAEYLYTENSGKLGASLMKIASMIYDEEFPAELREDAFMAGIQLIQEADDWANSDAFIREVGAQNADLVNIYDEYQLRHGSESTAARALNDAIVLSADMKRQEEELRMLAADEAERTEQEKLAQAREAIRYGKSYTQEQMDLVEKHAPAMDEAARMADPLYKQLSEQMLEEWEFGGSEWMDEQVLSMAEALGGDYTAQTDMDWAARVVAQGFLEDVLRKKTDVAYALGYRSLEAYAYSHGGITLDSLHTEARLEMLKLGSSLDSVDMAISEEAVRYAASGEGVSAGDIALAAGASGVLSAVGDPVEAFYNWMAATDLKRDSARVKATYDNDYGLYSETQLTADLNAMADGGYFPSDEMAQFVKEYLKAGGNPYELGLMPDDLQFVRKSAVAIKQTRKAYGNWAQRMLSPAQGMAFEAGSAIADNVTRMTLSGLVGAATGSSFIGTLAGFGSASYNEGAGMIYAKDAEEIRETGKIPKNTQRWANVMGTAQAVATAASEYMTLGKWADDVGRLWGVNSAVRAGMNDIGMTGAMRVWTGATKFFKFLAKQELDEVFIDEMKEGLLSQAAETGVLALRETAGTPMDALLSSIKGTMSAILSADDILQGVFDNAGMMAITVLPTALLGAGGAMKEALPRSYSAAKQLKNSGKGEDAGRFINTLLNETANATPEQMDAANKALHDVAVAEDAVVILTSDPEIEPTNTTAEKAQEQADAHETSEKNSMAAAEAGRASALAAQERMNAGEVNPELVTQVANGVSAHAKNSQSTIEHRREKEQKQLEADKAFSEGIKKAAAKAEAQVSTREAAAQQSAGTQGRLDAVRARIEALTAEGNAAAEADPNWIPSEEMMSELEALSSEAAALESQIAMENAPKIDETAVSAQRAQAEAALAQKDAEQNAQQAAYEQKVMAQQEADEMKPVYQTLSRTQVYVDDVQKANILSRTGLKNLGQVNRKYGLRLTSDKSKGAVSLDGSFFSELYDLAPGRIPQDVTVVEDALMDIVERKKQLKGMQASVGETAYEKYLPDGTFYAIKDPVMQQLTSDVKRATGVDIVVAPLAGNVRALYDRAEKRIIINSRIGAGEVSKKVVMHELTHYIEGSEGYDKYKEAVLKAAYAHDKDGKLREADEARILRTYADAGVALDAAGLESELVAEATEKIITDPDGYLTRQLLGQKQRGLLFNLMMKLRQFMARKQAQKAGNLEQYELIRTAYERLKEALSQGGGDSQSADPTADLDTTARRRGEVAHTSKDGQMQFALVNPGSHYDYSKPFAQQVDDLLSGKIPERDALLVSGTPELWQKIGLSRLPVTMNQEHIRKAVEGTRDTEHNISRELFEQMPDLLADPIAIIESGSGQDSSVVVIIKAVINGEPYIAPVYISSTDTSNGMRIDSNNIATVFRKDNAVRKLLTEAIDKEKAGSKAVGVYYINKTEARDLYEGAGVQFPGRSMKGGLMHSIFDAGSPVNRKYLEQTETKQFKHWFGNSAIRNADGTPKIMYRGGNEDIEIFDRKKSSHSNLYGRGFYFTESEEQASVYGNVYRYYLAVKHPLSATSGTKSIKDSQLRAFLEAVAEDEDYGLDNYGYGATVDGVISGLKGRTDFDILQDINATCIGDFVAAIELFNEVNGTNYDGIITPTETVVFDSKQIKSADKNVGLFDSNNPNVKYSLAPNQFGNKTAQELDTIDEAVKDILMGSKHEVVGNDERLETAWQAVNDRGADVVADELLSMPMRSWGAQENVNAALCAVLASRDGDNVTAAAILTRYDKEGTAQGQTLQTRQIIKRLSPEGAMLEMIRKADRKNAQKGIPKGSFPTGEGAPKKNAEKAHEDGSVERVHAAVQEVYHAADELKAELDTLPTDVSYDNPWNLPLAPWQMALVNRFKLIGEKLPGIHYNVATKKQRMLAAIIAADPAILGDGQTTLCQQLEAIDKGYAVVTAADLNYTASQMAELRAREGKDATIPKTPEGARALARAYQAQDNVATADALKKWTALRFANMLSAPATMVRNVAGNVIAGGMENAATVAASAIDRRVAKKTGTRTTATTTKAERKAGNAAFAQEVAHTMSDYMLDHVDTGHGRRYDVGGQGRIFQTEFLESYRNMVDFAMQIGDRPFFEQKYAEEKAVIERLGMKKTEATDNGTIVTRQMTQEEIHQEATARALHRVFQEDNMIVDWMNDLRGRSPYADLAITTLLPFIKTPTNVAVRAIEYSPIGLGLTLARKGLFGMDGGKALSISQYDYVMGIGRGLTGTGLMAAGVALAAAGMIGFGREDEENAGLREMKKAQGIPYGMYLNIGGQMREIDWAMPLASAIAMGADLYRALDDGEGLGDAASSAIFSNIGGQIMDTPMMSAMNDIFRGYDSAENVVWRVLKTGATSTLNQTFSPSIIRAFAKATDPYVRDTGADSAIMSEINKSVIQYWPGLRQLLPKATDVTGDFQLQGGYYSWGKDNQNAALHFLDSFFTPTATLGEKNDEALFELLDLAYTEGETDFLPRTIVTSNGKLTINKSLMQDTGRGDSAYTMTLTADERREFNRLYGDILFNGLRGARYDLPSGFEKRHKGVDLNQGIRRMMESGAWDRMSGEEKRSAVSKMKSAAKEICCYLAVMNEL